MSFRIRRVDYFYATVKDRPGELGEMLSYFAQQGVNLLAFNAIPIGPEVTQLALFPEVNWALTDSAAKSGMRLEGPHHAILVQGDDQLGALVDVHHKLAQAQVNVYASNAITDGNGRYGYLIYVRSDEFSKAASTLGI